VKLLELALPKLEGEDKRRALVAQARAYHALRDVDHARPRYEQVLATTPDDVDALVGLGRLLRETGQVTEARQRLEQARKVVLDNTGVALELAALAKMQGDHAQEKALYSEVLKRDGAKPEMWPVRLSLALLLAREGQTAAARQELEILAKRTESLPSTDARKLVHTAYATLLAKQGDRDGASREFGAALQEDPAFAPAKGGLAVLTALGGNPSVASSTLTTLIAGRDFADVRRLARLNLGKILWAMGRAAEAKPHLEETADAFPEDVAAQAALGEIALAAGDRATALKRLSAAQDGCSPSAPKRAVAGATSFLSLTIGADPNVWLCPRVSQALGSALVMTGADLLEKGRGESAVREAHDAADRALTLPLLPAARSVALYVRGSASLLADDVRAARRDLTASLADLPAALAPMAHNNLGAALYRDGAAREAQTQFETARSLKPGFASATLNLALALDGTPEAQHRALGLYEEYLALGGTRRDEVQKWTDTLRKVYP
jgi:tetratricopeptide (TPR) repeat protein